MPLDCIKIKPTEKKAYILIYILKDPLPLKILELVSFPGLKIISPVFSQASLNLISEQNPLLP